MSVTLGLPPSQATQILQAAEAKAGEQNAAAAQPPQAPAVPEPRVIREYPDDLKALIEKARKEEKDKLYDRIRRAEAVESENQAIKARVSDLEKINADLVRLSEDSGKKKSKKSDSDEIDLPALVQDTAAAVTKQLEEKFNAERKVMQESISALQARISGNDLATLRDRLVAEANGKIIAAMVRGSTEDEIRQSVLEAKAEYAKIVRSVGGQSSESAASMTASAPSPGVPSAQGTQPAAPTPVSRGEPTSPGADGVPALSEEQRLRDDLRNISREDYRKNRESILRRMKKIYPKGEGNPMLR